MIEQQKKGMERITLVLVRGSGRCARSSTGAAARAMATATAIDLVVVLLLPRPVLLDKFQLL